VLRKILAALVVVAATCAAAHSAEPVAGKPPAVLEVLVLGSGGPAALGRAASSYLVLLDGEPRLLVDAGPGSFARLGEAHVSLVALDTVLLTHLHVDHVAELPGIVKAVDGDRTAVTASIASQFHGTVQFAADGLRVQP
jgi:ribonuclease BN (tRNA processing enzyme)